jgi:hypothetical protein
MPSSAPRFCPWPQAEVVVAGGQQRSPDGTEVRTALQGGHGGIRDGHRTAMTGLDLRPRDEAGGAAQMSPGARWSCPRLGGQSEGHSSLQQPVPGGVEVSLVDPVALRRMRMQDRGITVCLVPPRWCLDSPSQCAECLELRPILLAAPALDPLAQRGIGRDDVVTARRRGLVGDLMGTHLREGRREPPRAPGSRLDSDPSDRLMSGRTHSGLLGRWRACGHSSVGRAQPCQG